MHKVKAFFGGLVQSNTSEFWIGWGGLLVKGLVLMVPAAAPVLDSIAGGVGFPSGSAMIATLLAYAAARMTSKAAKAEPSQADIARRN